MSNVLTTSPTASLAAIIVGAFATSSLLGQAPSSTFPEELISLSVIAEVRTPSYTVSDADAIVFVRDYVPIVVSIGNFTRDRLGIESSPQRWSETLSFTVDEVGETKGLLKKAGRRPIVGRANVANRIGPPTALSSNARTSERFFLRLDNEEELPAGRYRVRVSMDQNTLAPPARRFRNILDRELLIEVKEANTNDELVDQYLQLAYRAHASGRVQERREWAEKALALNRDSIAALNDLGNSFLFEGDCERAVRFLERVLVLLRSGGDPLINLSETSREDLAATLRGRLSARCPR